MKADKSEIWNKKIYKKQELLNKYEILSNYQLSLNGVYQLVTIVESILGDLLRIIIMRYPKKTGANLAY
jgi:hypothetical protein